MSILKILTYPDPFLKEPAKPVEKIDSGMRQLIDDMEETMNEASGVGLAAPQVGVGKRLIVFNANPKEEKNSFSFIINPEIVSFNGEVISEKEGCLSVPDYRANVKRAETIRVKGLDRDGKPINMEVDGTVSVIIQHEIDHLNGILFIDRISSLKRSLYKKKVKKRLKKEK